MTKAFVVPHLLARRWWLWALGLLGGQISMAAALWLILLRWMQGSGACLASQALGREVAFGHVDVMLWRLAVVLDNLRNGGVPGESADLLTVGRVHGAVSLRSIWDLRPILESLTVERPVLRRTRVAQGRYDVDFAFASLAPPMPRRCWCCRG